jgi:hypothetical protein
MDGPTTVFDLNADCGGIIPQHFVIAPTRKTCSNVHDTTLYPTDGVQHCGAVCVAVFLKYDLYVSE